MITDWWNNATVFFTFLVNNFLFISSTLWLSRISNTRVMFSIPAFKKDSFPLPWHPMVSKVPENNSPNNVLLLLSGTTESFVLDPPYRWGIVKMLQTAKGTQQAEDDKTRIYTWRAVETMADWCEHWADKITRRVSSALIVCTLKGIRGENASQRCCIRIN